MSEVQARANTSAPPAPVPNPQPQRQWGKIIVSSVLGGVVAVVAAPTIAAAAPVGFAWLVGANALAGVIGSVTTKVASNAIGANVTVVDYNPHRAQLRFRAAIMNHFDGHLEPIIAHIRSNSPGYWSQTTNLATKGCLVFLDQILNSTGHDKSTVFLRYTYQVVPHEGTDPRPIDEGAPLPPLPVHHELATDQLRLNEPAGLMEGMAGAVARGALFGGGIGVFGQFLGQSGPLWDRMFVLDTAPGMNMVFSAESISAAADPLCNLMPGPSVEDRMAYFIELVAEIQHHINRVSQCAMNNGVGLVYRVELGVHQDTNVTAAGATGRNEDTIWNVWEARIGV